MLSLNTNYFINSGLLKFYLRLNLLIAISIETQTNNLVSSGLFNFFVTT